MPETTLETVDYDSLTRIQKLALFMVVLGPEISAELLKNFDDAEAEQICREISLAPMLDESIQRKVLEEFSGVITQSLGAIQGGTEFAQRALELSKGNAKAAMLLTRIVPSGNSLEGIAQMEALQIHKLIRAEQPQTIAFVLSHLSQEKAAQVASMLDSQTCEEVLERLGSMEDTSAEQINRVARCLKKHALPSQSQGLQQTGGARTVAELLNMMDKQKSKHLLVRLEERNPPLGLDVRRKMFSFEDLIRLSPADLQRIARELEMADLVLAMKNASKRVQEAIFRSVSKRAAESIREEMEMLGSVRPKEIEAAQDRIIQIVRQLEEEGEVSLDMESEERA